MWNVSNNTIMLIYTIHQQWVLWKYIYSWAPIFVVSEQSIGSWVLGFVVSNIRNNKLMEKL